MKNAGGELFLVDFEDTVLAPSGDGATEDPFRISAVCEGKFVV
jgi:hypothetical protein